MSQEVQIRAFANDVAIVVVSSVTFKVKDTRGSGWTGIRTIRQKQLRTGPSQISSHCQNKEKKTQLNGHNFSWDDD